MDTASFKWTTGKSLVARAPLKPPFIIDPIVPSEGVTLLYGPPKVGKSALLWTMADAIRQGTQFLGALDVPEKRLSLIVNLDMPEWALQTRWQEGKYSSPRAHVITGPAVDITKLETDSPDVWAHLARKARRYPVVMIDSLYTIVRGWSLIDDNMPAVVIGQLNKLFPHKAIVLLHHSRKQAVGPNGLLPPTSEDFLGSQLWMASVQSQLQVYRNADNRTAHLRSNGAHVGIMDEGIDIALDDGGCIVIPYDQHVKQQQCQTLYTADSALVKVFPNWQKLPKMQRYNEMAKYVSNVMGQKCAGSTIRTWIRNSGYKLL